MNTKASILLLAAGLCATSTLQPSGGTTMVRAMYLISTPTPPRSSTARRSSLSVAVFVPSARSRALTARITSTTLRSASASDVMPSSAASAISAV